MSRTATPQDVIEGRARWCVVEGDCADALAALPDGCVDAVVCDPPYAEIDRPYGRMTEPEWETFAHALVRQSLRVLKPNGSAVFIVQPNSERVGRMRAWVFRFLAWCSDDLVRETGGRVGMVQDVWWWNIAAMPTVHTRREHGLLRQSIKPCVWVGPADCYRDQGAVLWKESDRNAANRASSRATNGEVIYRPSGVHLREGRLEATAAERGGVTPFNLLPMYNADSTNSAGAHGHGAGTPYNLAAWWVRYICPPDGVVCDPCGGSGTMGLAALAQNRRVILMERDPAYAEIARARLERAAETPVQLDLLGRGGSQAADPVVK